MTEEEKQELEALRVIDCLKKSGLELRDIKQFMASVRSSSVRRRPWKLPVFPHRLPPCWQGWMILTPTSGQRCSARLIKRL